MVEAKTEVRQARYCEGCRLWLKNERFSHFALICADCATADGVIAEWTRQDLLDIHTGRNARGERLAYMRHQVEGDGAHTVYPRPGWSIKFEVGGVNVYIHGIPTLDMAKASAPEMLGIMEKAMLD